MYDLITYTTNKGQSGTLDPSSSPSVITRTIDFDTVWIDLSVDLESSPNPEYIRGWFFELNELSGYSFYPNSSAIQTGLNPPEKKVFTSNSKVRLYIDLNTMLLPDGLRPHDFVLSTVVATSEENLKNGNWIETNRSDLIFTIYANGNPELEFLDTLPETLFESDFGDPTTNFRIDSAYINGMRVDSAHIRHLAYVNLLEGDSAYFTNITTNKILTNLLSANINSDISILSNLNIDSNKIIGIGSENSGNVLDLDYDEPTDRNNSIALTSLQSIHNFLDVNNSEDSNYWALYNNLNAYSDSINRNNAIFLIDEDGTVTAKAINVNQYILDSDGLKWSNDSNARIYYDSNLKLWKIEPGLFTIQDSEAGDGEETQDTVSLISAGKDGRDGQFLSFAESAQSFYLDYALKVGRFVIDEESLEEEKEYIPDTQFELMDSNAKYRYYDQFSRFSHFDLQQLDSDPEDPFTFPFNDSDAQVLNYDETTNSIYGNFATRTFSGLISPKKYNSYKVKATFNSTSPTDFPIFLVVAQLKIRGKEYTISAFRRPKGTFQTYGEYLNSGQIIVDPPSWGLVYNFGQPDEYYLDFDWVSRGAAPAPVTPTFEGETTSDWVSSGQTTIFAEKNGNVITVATNQFGDPNIENFEFRTGIELDIEQAIISGKTFLEPFLNAETSYGFGVQDQSDVIISDIVFETEGTDQYIFDLKNNLIYTYISERNINDGNIPTVPALVENAGYYALDSSIGISDIVNTGRFFYNPRTKTLFWSDPGNTYKLIQEVDLTGGTSGNVVELRGTGLDSNSLPYLYINNEKEYFDFNENPALLQGYRGHGRGLNLTIFENDGTKISSETYDIHGDSLGSTSLANAINDMSKGQIGTLTSFNTWITKINDDLKTAAFNQGLMKLYNVANVDSASSIGNPYAAVFQKTENETARAHETTAVDSSLHADLTFSFIRGNFHTYGPEQPNSLTSWNGKKEAWIDGNHNTKINQTLMLTEGRLKGMAFEGTSFTSTGINEDSARIYLVSEEDSQRTLIIRVGNENNDKIAFEVPDINGVLQNGFINFHRGNLEIEYDQSPKLGGDLDVQEYRIYKDSGSHELFDLGYSLGKGNNSVATASRQSIFNFIDRDDDETDNFFGIFTDINPSLEATTRTDAIFAVMEDGTTYFTGPADFTGVPAGNNPANPGEGTGRFPGLTTDDVPHGPSGKNLYFDSARIFLDAQVSNTNNNSNYNASEGGIGSISIDRSTVPDTIEFKGITNTDGLPEGTNNLYFTDERAQDAVGSIMSGDDVITVTYDDGANTISISSSITEETLLGLQTSYSLTSVGGNTNANIRLVIESDGITRNEDVGITGTNGIVVNGGTDGSIVISAGELQKSTTFFSDSVAGIVRLVFRESDIVNFAVDDPVSLLGTNGISLTQQNGNEITISGADLQAVSNIYSDSHGGNVFIRLNDSSPVNGSTLSSVQFSGTNGVEIEAIDIGTTYSKINISAAALQLTSTLQANTTQPGVGARITFAEVDGNGDSSKQFIRFAGSGGIKIVSRGPQGTDDGQITISADSMNHPNTTYIANFATPLLSPSNEVDFNLLHEGPDSGQDTTLKIRSTDGILIEESDGVLVIGSVVQIEQINNETITFTSNADSAIKFGAVNSFTVNSSTSKSIEINHGNTGSGNAAATNNSGQDVIQNVTVDKFGHIQSVTSTTIAGSYLMSATDANGDKVIRLDTQSNGQSGSAEDVIIEGQGAVKVSVDPGGTKIILRVDSGDFQNIALDDLTDVTNNSTNALSGLDAIGGTNYHVGQVPVWNGTEFSTRKLNFNGDDITDLDVSGVSASQVLAWVGPNFPTGSGQNAWRNASLTDLLTGILSINDLNDVTDSSASDGNLLVWDTDKFINKAFDSLQISIGELVDVTLDGIANGKALIWNNTTSQFEPQNIILSLGMNDLDDVFTAGISHGQTLVYDSDNLRYIPGYYVDSIYTREIIEDFFFDSSDSNQFNFFDLIDSHLNVGLAEPNQILKWTGTDYSWDSGLDIDSHLNVGLAASNQILKWTGTDYSWDSGLDIDSHLNTGLATPNQLLKWTGTQYSWDSDLDTTYDVVTVDSDGLMSATDKFKLDGIEDSANKYILAVASADSIGGIKIGYTDTGTKKAVQLDNSDKAYVDVGVAADTNTTYSIKASTVSGGAGLDLDAGGSGSGTDTVNFKGGGATTVSRTDASNITITSTDTTYGLATGTAAGLVTLGSTTYNTISIANPSSTAGRNYPVQAYAPQSNGTGTTGRMVVNVPWENTTYTAGNGLSLSSNQFTMSGTYTGDFGVTGTITATQDIIAYGTVSDINQKEDISVIQNALEKVKNIRGVTFRYKGETGRMTGVIAQEVAEVLPEVVMKTKKFDEDEETLAVRYGNMVGLLVEAIKELSDKVEVLEEKLKRYE